MSDFSNRSSFYFGIPDRKRELFRPPSRLCRKVPSHCNGYHPLDTIFFPTDIIDRLSLSWLPPSASCPPSRSRCWLIFPPYCPRAEMYSSSGTQTSTTWQWSTRPCWWNSTLHGNGAATVSIANMMFFVFMWRKADRYGVVREPVLRHPSLLLPFWLPPPPSSPFSYSSALLPYCHNSSIPPLIVLSPSLFPSLLSFNFLLSHLCFDHFFLSGAVTVRSWLQSLRKQRRDSREASS